MFYVAWFGAYLMYACLVKRTTVFSDYASKQEGEDHNLATRSGRGKDEKSILRIVPKNAMITLKTDKLVRGDIYIKNGM